MTARGAMARAEAANIRLLLSPDGEAWAEPPPPPDLLAELRAHRAAIAALLATAIRSADLPACPTCAGQHFWRSLDLTHGAVGDWVCARLPIPPEVMLADILGPAQGKAKTVVSVLPTELADAESFALLLCRWGADIVVAMPDPANPRSHGTKVRGCE